MRFFDVERTEWSAHYWIGPLGIHIFYDSIPPGISFGWCAAWYKDPRA
jgi:hypothetical protein